MATHRRTVLRDAMRDVLMDAFPAFRTRIYKHHPAAIEKLPAIRISTPEERLLEERQGFGEELVQTAQIVVEALVAKGTEADDAIDAICLTVEQAVENELARADAANELPFRRGCAAMVLVSTSIDFEDNNETRVLATMTFDAPTQQAYIQE